MVVGGYAFDEHSQGYRVDCIFLEVAKAVVIVFIAHRRD